MNRTTFLVDGLNLYHSVKNASHDLGGAGTRWLDRGSRGESGAKSQGSGSTNKAEGSGKKSGKPGGERHH